jgi:bifunctional non-homologous end joining protein LigD
LSLTRYQTMRHFSQTPEPAGGVASRGAPIFVVQLHHASHRHYDFRLEHGGVLKSWAVPKGPSFDPEVKRLAVEVEDHPLDYATFEGVIPEGNYGAGDVRVFDHGTWSCDGNIDAELAKGHLHFSLDGEKLQGAWDLIRTGRGDGKQKPQWLLRKAPDDEAGPFESDDLLGDPDDYHLPSAVWRSNRNGATRPRARAHRARPKKAAPNADAEDHGALERAPRESIDDGFFAPELARAIESPPTGSEWIHEPKWDGYRLLCAAAHGKIRLWSRNGIEWTQRVPHVVEALAQIGARSLRLDGELVALHESGKVSNADFNQLQATLAGEANASLRYVVFDLLHADGLDLSGLPLLDRKRMLHALLARVTKRDVIVEGEYHANVDGTTLYRKLVKAGYEGVVSKRAASRYRAGRGDDWRKCRAREAEEVAVVGYTQPKGARVGIGALLMGRPVADGWDYAGRVGTGLKQQLLLSLAQRLRPLERESPPVRPESLVVPRQNGDLRGVHWVTPKLAVEVEFHGRGKGGLLRQPSVKTLRLDKRAQDLTVEGDRALAPETPMSPLVRLTHPERVVYPQGGITKGEVFAYYEAVSRFMLPEISRRPLAIVRCPDGPAGTCFFQKHVKDGFGPHVHGVAIADTHGKREQHLYVEDQAGLLELAQMNAIEIHPWGCHIADPEGCDRVVFDLDPADDVPWKRVVDTAKTLRKALAALKLVSFVRLSGGKGLHVVVPLRPVVSWDDAKGFAHALAQGLAQQRPDEIIDVMTKARRGGRIFVDYLRNGRGATSVASYSLRRQPEATVAMPLDWAELGKVSGPKAFDLRATLARLAKRKRDPWDGIDAVKQELPRLR